MLIAGGGGDIDKHGALLRIVSTSTAGRARRRRVGGSRGENVRRFSAVSGRTPGAHGRGKSGGGGGGEGGGRGRKEAVGADDDDPKGQTRRRRRRRRVRRRRVRQERGQTRRRRKRRRSNRRPDAAVAAVAALVRGHGLPRPRGPVRLRPRHHGSENTRGTRRVARGADGWLLADARRRRRRRARAVRAREDAIERFTPARFTR